MNNILIAEPNFLLREGLKAVISTSDEHKVVGEAITRLDLIAKLRCLSVDILLLDVALEGPTGEALIRRIKNTAPWVYLIGFSDIDEFYLNARAIKSGLNALIKKNCGTDELLLAIGRAATGRPYITETFTEQLASSLTSDFVPMPHQQLTEREMDICARLLKGSRIKRIADELFLSKKTVSTHKSKLLRKMGFSNMVELVRYARDHNLI